MTEDEPIDEEELAEARALAEELEGVTSLRGAPTDALEAAALVRYSKAELTPERQDAILERVFDAKPARQKAPEKKRGTLLWYALPPLAIAAAIALAYVNVTAPTAATLPDPSVDLLQAQLAASSHDARAAAGLESHMRGYRTEVLASLETRYRSDR